MVAGVSDQLSELNLEAKKVVRNLLKNDSYTSNPFNEDGVIDLVWDIRSLSDNTCLNIL